jgi:hypothetical protein
MQTQMTTLDIQTLTQQPRPTLAQALFVRSESTSDRDYNVMHKAASCEGGAHHVWLATQGLNVYERMAFDRE